MSKRHPSEKVKIAVFASGNGSNFETIVEATKSGKIEAELALLVTDRPNAFVVERANEAGIPTFSFSPKTYSSKDLFEQEIIEHLRTHQIEWIFLAGYMRLIGPKLLQAYESKIVNVHPSLLPKFPGKDAIGQAFDARVSEMGITIHFVDAGMDTGPIIAQRSIEITPLETREQIEKRIHELEHELYPITIQKLVTEV